MNKMQKWEKEIESANGSRRARIVTLQEIKEKVEKIVNEYSGNKKNIRYLEIENKISVSKSYNYCTYYTKWKATLTHEGNIKTLKCSEEKSQEKPFGEDSIIVNISIENIEKITGCKLENAKHSVIKLLKNSILEGKI